MEKANLGGPDKSRGFKHRKDKNKYKPKSSKDAKNVPRKAKVNLGSNWDRYDNEDDETPQLTSSTDFSLLANAPIVQGQHFQFKHDKLVTDEVGTSSQELFSLDLNMLRYSILTVPFYKRIGMDETYFGQNQISFMNKNAEEGVISYNERYCSNKTPCEYTESSNNNEVQEDLVGFDINKDVTEGVKDGDNVTTTLNESDSTREVIEKTDSVKLVNKEAEKSEDDLEQWLDNILDQ